MGVKKGIAEGGAAKILLCVSQESKKSLDNCIESPLGEFWGDDPELEGSVSSRELQFAQLIHARG